MSMAYVTLIVCDPDECPVCNATRWLEDELPALSLQVLVKNPGVSHIALMVWSGPLAGTRLQARRAAGGRSAA